MSILLTLLEIVVPVFVLICAGYLSVFSKFLTDGIMDALIKFQVSIAVPVLLFNAMFHTDLSTSLNVYAMIGFFGSGTVAFFAAIFLSRAIWKRRPGEAVAVGFCAFFPNAVMLGIPIADRAFGEATMGAVFGIIAFHSMYNWFMGFVTMEAVRRDSETIWAGFRKAFTTTFQNPLMIGLMLGMAANLIALPIPTVGQDALNMMADAALPVALFALGGVLTRYSIKAEIGEALMVSVLSLFIHPAVAWVITAQIFDLSVEYVQATVLIACMPTGINSYIFATVYNRAVGTAASTVIIATILSLATITGWLWFLGV
ncbi:MAG: AEC family transporter [Pseudomonadota bacterium]